MEPSGGDVDVSDSALEDSDAESVYSVADSGVEPEDDDNDEHDGNEDAEVGNAGDLHAPELGQRLPGGTWVVWSNGYFTFTDTTGYDDCKIRIKPRWAKKGLLGDKNMSKNFPFDDYGGDVQLCFLMARAWMVSRFSHDGFADQTPFRQNWLSHQTDQLRADLSGRRVAAGGVGNENADALLKKLCPSVLP